jgi:hypothetical protein
MVQGAAGLFDDLRVWNRKLTPAEVRRHAKSGNIIGTLAARPDGPFAFTARDVTPGIYEVWATSGGVSAKVLGVAVTGR